jgi:hypothetical protein
MVERGIIDPAKVTRSAMENAASIAAMILTTEALVTEIPEKEKALRRALRLSRHADRGHRRLVGPGRALVHRRR